MHRSRSRHWSDRGCPRSPVLTSPSPIPSKLATEVRAYRSVIPRSRGRSVVGGRARAQRGWTRPASASGRAAPPSPATDSRSARCATRPAGQAYRAGTGVGSWCPTTRRVTLHMRARVGSLGNPPHPPPVLAGVVNRSHRPAQREHKPRRAGVPVVDLGGGGGFSAAPAWAGLHAGFEHAGTLAAGSSIRPSSRASTATTKPRLGTLGAAGATTVVRTPTTGRRTRHPALVDRDDLEVPGQPRHQHAPRVPGLRPAMHQQQRRPVASDDRV